MKAYVLESIGRLEYRDVPYPDCPESWAIVKVKAAGICSSDIPRVYRNGTYHFPTIIGHEFAGEIFEVGSDADKALVGKRVSVFPLIPCRKCESCRMGSYETCSNYDYVGSRRDGGFAEFVAVPVWNLVELPDNVSFETGAMMEPLSVAYHAVKRASLSKDEKVAVIGTGMIGLAAAQWAKALGASRVTVFGRGEAKRTAVEQFEGVDYSAEQKAGEPYDVVIEAVGSNESIQRAIAAAGNNSTIVLMGNPNGDIVLEKASYWQILRKQLTVIGTWNSKYEKCGASDWQVVKDALSNGTIRVDPLISHVYAQDELIKGLKMMEEHKVAYIKVMITWNREE